MIENAFLRRLLKSKLLIFFKPEVKKREQICCLHEFKQKRRTQTKFVI